MDWSQCKAVWRDPERCGGQWCFDGTRMPVVSLFEHLEYGSTLDEFLEWFPEMKMEQIQEVLRFAKASLEVPAAA
jgi:uncharacterized protein (DUF433 family)